tara:strand:+ start:18332 stop:18934 length:603 start_codon:yes stop_codon:yes gene_type:complete
VIKLACKIPKKIVLACSGGRDSMSALEFLVRGRRDVTVAYFNHATPHGDDAEAFLKDFCDTQSLPLVVGKYQHKDDQKEPTEASWRVQRYEFLKKQNTTVLTAHHLKDAVEWWIFSSLRGNPALIAPTRKDIPVIRPFITSHPDDLHTHFNEYKHIEDPSNKSTKFTRNFIRHEILHRAERVNPGLYTTIKNMYERHDND